MSAHTCPGWDGPAPRRPAGRTWPIGGAAGVSVTSSLRAGMGAGGACCATAAVAALGFMGRGADAPWTTGVCGLDAILAGSGAWLVCTCGCSTTAGGCNAGLAVGVGSMNSSAGALATCVGDCGAGAGRSTNTAVTAVTADRTPTTHQALLPLRGTGGLTRQPSGTFGCWVASTPRCIGRVAANDPTVESVSCWLRATNKSSSRCARRV